ncbi:lipid asymmetry maintenance protein MlaB [Colwellia sp. C1TZA3]|uniref:STAS domain-containing protein n=1 Tax=Colwellia sp. C1TZA3 TaxID=2508879 RepID=UPI0011BA30CB|nr:STAS domain-containing protein [Colwellia sp. C1TZA3]TWX72761.1 STAS domain-containing protein [Colwellia sp. C1TZA3]
MTIKIDNFEDHCTIKIDQDLTIYEVDEYRKQLLEKCDLNHSATVELSDEVELDTAGIQLLISLQKQLQATGGDLTVCTTSVQAINLFAVFNLSSQFKLTDRAF